MTNISAKFDISVYFKENETISMQTASDESWKLCVLAYSLNTRTMSINKANGMLFGIGPDSEDLTPFEALLTIGESGPQASYKILQICVLEV